MFMVQGKVLGNTMRKRARFRLYIVCLIINITFVEVFRKNIFVSITIITHSIVSCLTPFLSKLLATVLFSTPHQEPYFQCITPRLWICFISSRLFCPVVYAFQTKYVAVVAFCISDSLAWIIMTWTIGCGLNLVFAGGELHFNIFRRISQCDFSI